MDRVSVDVRIGAAVRELRSPVGKRVVDLIRAETRGRAEHPACRHDALLRLESDERIPGKGAEGGCDRTIVEAFIRKKLLQYTFRKPSGCFSRIKGLSPNKIT
jgi:hypothetical protein